MKHIKELSTHPEWQQLRKQLLNKWMCKPDWCCLKLRKYIGNIFSCHNTKLKIVNSYLNSSGFRPGAINFQCINKLKSEVYLEIKKRKTKNTWN